MSLPGRPKGEDRRAQHPGTRVTSPRWRRVARVGALAALTATLALVFAAWLRPDNLVDWLSMNSFCA